MHHLGLPLLLILMALLVTAAATDIRSRIIPNALTLAIALLAVPWWLAMGLDTVAMAWQAGIAFAVLAAFAGCFALGMMGGGDVKLLAALALWLPLGPLMRMLVLMSLAGGVLTLALWAAHRLRRRTDALEVPYGVAIVAASLMIVANDILTLSAA